jgi:transcriptional regulator with XRE-family HTH domain
MSTLRARFGRAVRRLRLAGKPKGISQERFALLAGINRSYMGRIERGEVNASLDLIERISKALRISVGKLFTEVDKE